MNSKIINVDNRTLDHLDIAICKWQAPLRAEHDNCDSWCNYHKNHETNRHRSKPRGKR